MALRLHSEYLSRSITGREILILGTALIVAFLLRAWGNEFGLPYRYHPDEPQHIVEAATMLDERSLEPSQFNNPPFFKYLLMGADAAYAAGVLITDRSMTLDELAENLKLDPSPLYRIGRFISALAGTATVLLTYLVGKLTHSNRVGLFAAGLLAVAFLHVRESHYAVNDALLALLTTASLLGSIRIVQKGDTSSYVFAAGAAGLAFATKYTGALALLTLTAAHFLSPTRPPRRLGLRRLLQAWLIAAIVAVLASPYFILRPGKVLRDVAGSVYSYGRSGFEGWQIDAAGGFSYYLRSLTWGLGIGLLILCTIGVILALRRRTNEDLLLLGYPAAFFIFMGFQQMYFARLLLPTIPPLLILGASAVCKIARWVKGTKTGSTYLAARGDLQVSLLLFIVVSIQPLSSSIRHNVLLSRTDTRTVAKSWIESNIPPDSKIAADWPHHIPPLSTGTDPELGSTRDYELLAVGGNGLSDHPLDYYYANGFDYLIESSFISKLQLADPSEDRRRTAFYSSLPDELELVYQTEMSDIHTVFVFDEIYGPATDLWSLTQPGPIIRIYQLAADEKTGRTFQR